MATLNFASLAQLPFSVVSLAFATMVHAQSTIYLSPATNAYSAPNISQIIPPSFAGMGIEPSNLYAFTGGPHKNLLTPGLLQNLGDYSGVPPQLRIGGNSQDNMVWEDDWNEYYFGQNTNTTQAGQTPADAFFFGPTYFECLNRLPLGSPIVFGLNLAYNGADWATRVTASARAALTMLKNPAVIGFEIGNEPDIYTGNYREVGYGGVQFIAEWISRAEAVTSGVLSDMNITSMFFEPSTTASTIGKPTFEIASMMTEGINVTSNITNSSYIHGWNQHDYFYFVNVSHYDLTLEWLMDLDNTEAQFAYWAKQVAIGLSYGYPYYLREMASAGPVGLQGISDTFGAALWTLNFFLYAASLNISAIGIHMTANSYAAPWQPNTVNGVEQHVRPSYYAFAAFAQLLGNCNGTARVAEFLGNQSNIRAYGIYGNDTLRSIIMINSNLVNDTSSNSSGVTFDLNIPELKNQVLYLSTLTAGGANFTTGTTWNGLTYSDSDGSSSGDSVSSAGNASFDDSGRATIAVRNTQAIVANIGWVLGTNAVSTPNSTDPTMHNAKSDAAKASAAARTSALIAASSSLLAGATSLSADPSAGGSAKKSGAPSTGSGHVGIVLAIVAGAASLGAAHILWRIG